MTDIEMDERPACGLSSLSAHEPDAYKIHIKYLFYNIPTTFGL